MTGGQPVSGTATLDCTASPTDITINLYSDDASAAVVDQPSIVISAGQRNKSFTITTKAVTQTKSPMIIARANGGKKNTRLVVNP